MKPGQQVPKNIILIGMPGAGKTTLGQALASRIDWAHVDTDSLLESWWGQNLQTLWDRLGLDAFLDAEANMIQKMNLRRCVISTGGSVVYRAEAMHALRIHGSIVYLRSPLAVLETRLTNFTSRGIVIRPGQSLEELYAERAALYSRYADFELDTDSSLENCLDILIGWFKRQGF